jgi:hypothetical protein
VPNFHPAMSSTVRRVCRNVQRWRLEAPELHLVDAFQDYASDYAKATITCSRSCSPSQRRLTSIFGRDRFSMFNNERDIFQATDSVQSISSLGDRTSDTSGTTI